MMPHVDNHGVRISYRTYGGGDPLVLIHGWSGEGRHWDHLQAVLGRDQLLDAMRQFIRVDKLAEAG